MIIIIAGLAFWLSPKPAGLVMHLPTDLSKKYIKPAGWLGTPVDSKQRFINHEYPFYQNYLKILIWSPGHLLNLFRNRHLEFPVEYHTSGSILDENETIIWLGHASFFLRINNVNVLIDPHFYNTVIYKRHSDNPVPPSLFRNIDYILLSHDHADHCDKRSLQLLIDNNPDVIIIAGLNMDRLIQSFSARKLNLITADWYEEIRLTAGINICFVPGRHYSKRIFEKFNSRLWGGFVISYKESNGDQRTIYFAGDSGYGSHYKDIKDLFKPDIAILPIGSYMPGWLMHPNHMSPLEAIQAFKDCGAKWMIPMHFGTFNLSNEGMDIPEKVLLNNIEQNHLLRFKPGMKYTIKDR